MFWFLLPLIVQGTSCFSGNFFSQISLLEDTDYFIGRVGTVFPNTFYSQCAGLCVGLSDCWSFIHNEHSKMCRPVFRFTGSVLNETFTGIWTYVAVHKKNCALGKSTSSSSVDSSGYSSRGVDGGRHHAYSMGSCFHTRNDLNPYWMVDLGQDYVIYEIMIANRGKATISRSSTVSRRLQNLYVTTRTQSGSYQHCAYFAGPGLNNQFIYFQCVNAPTTARYVKLQMMQTEKFHLCEVEVYGDC